MQIIESATITAAINNAIGRDYYCVHNWVMANPNLSAVAGWDGHNPIEIAEEAILFGAAAQQHGFSTIFRADANESSYFFAGDENSIVNLLNSL